MPYKFENFKEWLTSKEGMQASLKVAGKSEALFEIKNLILAGELLDKTGDSWKSMAAVDNWFYHYEGIVVELKNPLSEMWQHRLFVRKRVCLGTDTPYPI